MTEQTTAEHTTIEQTTIEHTTTENTGIRKIERRLKDTRRYSARIRQRNMCPVCNSLDVAKRITTKDYVCYNCKWIGKDIDKIMA